MVKSYFTCLNLVTNFGLIEHWRRITKVEVRRRYGER